MLKNGFSQDDLEELGDTQKLDQMIKYFYEEMLEQNDLALVSAHKLADSAKTSSEQQYVLLFLKLTAQKDLDDDLKRLAAARMLKYLIEIDKMRFSNVNFRNSLDYLALQWKR